VSDDPLRPSAGKTLLQALLLPVMAYAVIGLVISLFAHLMSLEGVRLGGHPLFTALNVGIIPLYVVAGLVMMRRGGISAEGHDLAVALAGCPPWMRWMTNAFFVYTFVNFLICIVIDPHPHATADTDHPSVTVWRVFSGGWMMFYAAGLGTLTSAYRQGLSPRKP
jgi:hypothetical protein